MDFTNENNKNSINNNINNNTINNNRNNNKSIINEEEIEETEETKTKQTKKKGDGLSKWQIVAMILITLAIIIIAIVIIFNIQKNKTTDKPSNPSDETKDPEPDQDHPQKPDDAQTQTDKRQQEQYDGVNVGTTSNFNGVSITTKNEIKKGSYLDAGIKTPDNFKLSSNAELAIKLETKGSSITGVKINGENVLGGFNVENGRVEYVSSSGELKNISLNDASVYYNGKKLSDSVLNAMNEISYDDKGNVKINTLNIISSYDDHKNATFTYQLSDGTTFGSTTFDGVIEKDGKYYYGSDSTVLGTEYSNLLKQMDSILDDKYALTKDVLLQNTMTGYKPLNNNSHLGLSNMGNEKEV